MKKFKKNEVSLQVESSLAYRDKKIISMKQAGASLIEIIAYLGLAGLIIAGALAVYAGAASSQGANQVTSDIASVKTAVRSLWGSVSNYGTVNMLPTLSQAKRLPSTWTTVGAGAAMTASYFNGGIGVVGQTATFAITYDGIAPDICTAVISQQGAQAWSSVFVGNAAGNVTPLTSGSVTTFDPGTVSTACSGTSKKITLVSG